MKKIKVLQGMAQADKISLLVALVIAYFTASSAFATVLVSKMMPNIGVIIVLVIAFLVVTSIFGGGNPLTGGLITLIMLGLMALVFWNSFVTAYAEVFGVQVQLPEVAREDIFDLVIVGALIFLFLWLLGFLKTSDKGVIALFKPQWGWPPFNN